MKDHISSPVFFFSSSHFQFPIQRQSHRSTVDNGKYTQIIWWKIKLMRQDSLNVPCRIEVLFYLPFHRLCTSSDEVHQRRWIKIPHLISLEWGANAEADEDRNGEEEEPRSEQWHLDECVINIREKDQWYRTENMNANCKNCLFLSLIMIDVWMIVLYDKFNYSFS